MANLQDLVGDLYAELDDIANAHEEVSDTEVREALHLTLNYYFVWDKPQDRLPVSYGMFTEDGDAAVAAAVAAFLAEASPLADREGLPVGQERLDLLQGELPEPEGESLSEFIGYSEAPLDPEPPRPYRFEPGDYDGDGEDEEEEFDGDDDDA